jgi:RimJ/RimL family protein N-acetyltransferase
VLGELWWGRGVGRAAARLLMGFAFDTLKVTRLESRVASTNERGRKLMIRLGAICHGVDDNQELWSLQATERDSLPNGLRPLSQAMTPRRQGRR